MLYYALMFLVVGVICRSLEYSRGGRGGGLIVETLHVPRVFILRRTSPTLA